MDITCQDFDITSISLESCIVPTERHKMREMGKIVYSIEGFPYTMQTASFAATAAGAMQPSDTGHC